MFQNLSFDPYLVKTQIVIKTLFSKKGLLLLPPLMSMPFVMTTTKKAIAFLVVLMIFDFATGIGASYSRKKKREKENPNIEKLPLISSEKLKKSGVKFLLYSMTILTSYFMGIIFELKTFELSISDLQLNLCIGVIAFWCLVECYSIFFENFKDMGLDIKSIVRKLTGLIKFFKDKTKDVCN